MIVDRARVPTTAGTSALVVNARSSARWPTIESTQTANHIHVV
jgi:hypothetical protein